MGEYVISGSDCGNIFIWDKTTRRLVNVMHGDEDVVNCVQGHPYHCLLATSGIEDDVKLWSPNFDVPKRNDEEMAKYSKENRERYKTSSSERSVHIPASILQALMRGDIALDEEDGPSACNPQ